MQIKIGLPMSVSYGKNTQELPEKCVDFYGFNLKVLGQFAIFRNVFF
jgi:hypothetical protein